MTLAAIDAPEHCGLTLARSLFDPCVSIAVTDPRASYNHVLAQESAPMARMAPIRQKSFAAGRAAAHRAMQALNHPVMPVLMGPDRAPLWPAGLVGSISHSVTCCIAVVALGADVTALGVDVEEDSGLEEDLIPVVCSQSERDWLATQPPEQAGVLAKLIFSAKECAYKAQYPRSKTLFGFDTLEVALALENDTFAVMFLRDVPEFPVETQLSGRFAIKDGLIITAMTIRP